MNLFATAEPKRPTEKKVRKGPIMDRLEAHFRENRYSTFTMVELYDIFPEAEPQAIRNALRKMFKENLIRSTGESRLPTRCRDRHPGPDTVCLTLHIGK